MKISFSLFLRLLLPSLPPEGYNGPMKMLEIKIEEAMAGRTVRSVLLREGHMAASHLSSLKFREGGLLLNGQWARSSDVLRPGDMLAARIDDGRGENPAQPMEAPLDFVWEDEYLAVLNKAAGMAVHGSLQGGACTVANALAARWGREQTFHPVNRLDRGTSGLMLIAKSAYLHDRLRLALHSDSLRREYLALVEGVMDPPCGHITLPIGSDGTPRRRVDRQGQSAHTEYATLLTHGGLSLLRLTLHTGRTHQIRVHLSALGHPLLGDALYGGCAAEPGRPALHSFLLRFTHPITGEVIECRAPLPEDLRIFPVVRAWEGK